MATIASQAAPSSDAKVATSTTANVASKSIIASEAGASPKAKVAMTASVTAFKSKSVVSSPVTISSSTSTPAASTQVQDGNGVTPATSVSNGISSGQAEGGNGVVPMTVAPVANGKPSEQGQTGHGGAPLPVAISTTVPVASTQAQVGNGASPATSVSEGISSGQAEGGNGVVPVTVAPVANGNPSEQGQTGNSGAPIGTEVSQGQTGNSGAPLGTEVSQGQNESPVAPSSVMSINILEGSAVTAGCGMMTLLVALVDFLETAAWTTTLLQDMAAPLPSSARLNPSTPHSATGLVIQRHHRFSYALAPDTDPVTTTLYLQPSRVAGLSAVQMHKLKVLAAPWFDGEDAVVMRNVHGVGASQAEVVGGLLKRVKGLVEEAGREAEEMVGTPVDLRHVKKGKRDVRFPESWKVVQQVEVGKVTKIMDHRAIVSDIEETPALLRAHQVKVMQANKAASHAATEIKSVDNSRTPLIVDLSNPNNSNDAVVVEADTAAAAAAESSAEGRSKDKIDAKFKFEWLEHANLSIYRDKELQSLLFKWGMQDHCYMKRFSFDKQLKPYQIDEFLMDFFNDGNVNKHLKVLGTKDRWGSLGRVERVDKEDTLHSVTSLTFFDRLSTSADVVRQDGSIKKCLDEYVDSFVVADELRKCLLMPESETYSSFSEEDRKEFVFHVFRALCLGGKVCQYEDEIGEYLGATKKVYKDLISVTKDTSGSLVVSSLVFEIKGVASSVSPLFPCEHPQNFCYVSVDAGKRVVNVWYHASDVYY
ncbi:hypothetical protein HDU98_001860 [Podochytrium sp. JEL0797]|nr:hypothetical protein HDU98_001860 [Podochytrium sp. JEL0797]